MPTEIIFSGPKFEIRAWVSRNGECQVKEFLNDLEEDDVSDADRLWYLLKRTANIGVLENKVQMRPLRSGIYEFKARHTARILFFYDQNRLIICSHGFTGKKGKGNRAIQGQLERALRAKEDYFGERGKGK